MTINYFLGLHFQHSLDTALTALHLEILAVQKQLCQSTRVKLYQL